jgi:DNA polymerase epsilon subunit 2
MEQQRRMKTVQQKFRMKGFTLTLDALKAAVGFVYEASGSSGDAMESLLASTDDHPSLRSNVLDKATVEAIIAEVKGVDDHTQGRRVLQVVDAFAVPKISFDPVRKLLHAQSGSGALHGEAQAKASLYRERFLLLQQRILKDKYFAKPAFEGHGSQFGSCEITMLQSLVGCTGNRWVMGVILQVEDGRFHLEDLSAVVPVDISEAKITAGFFTENSVVLAEGEFQVDGVFKVYTMGFPPLERRQTSLQSAAGLSLLAGAPVTMEEYVRLERHVCSALRCVA